MVKSPPASTAGIRDVGLIPGLERSSGEGNDNPLQYSCLENLIHGQGNLAGYRPWGPQKRTHLDKKSRDQVGIKKPEVQKESRSVVSSSLRPLGLKPTTLLCPWDFPGKSTGVCCHFLRQRIFLTQGLNPGLPHCRQTLYQCLHPNKHLLQ